MLIIHWAYAHLLFAFFAVVRKISPDSFTCCRFYVHSFSRRLLRLWFRSLVCRVRNVLADRWSTYLFVREKEDSTLANSELKVLWSSRLLSSQNVESIAERILGDIVGYEVTRWMVKQVFLQNLLSALKSLPSDDVNISINSHYSSSLTLGRANSMVRGNAIIEAQCSARMLDRHTWCFVLTWKDKARV